MPPARQGERSHLRRETLPEVQIGGSRRSDFSLQRCLTAEASTNFPPAASDAIVSDSCKQDYILHILSDSQILHLCLQLILGIEKFWYSFVVYCNIHQIF